MNWSSFIKNFKSYLTLERSLSGNSIEAYLRDVEKLTQFLKYAGLDLSPAEIDIKHLQEFIAWINELGVTATTQARIISGIKAFYKFLLMENLITIDPTALLEGPKLGRKLPDTLSLEEIDALVAAVDLSTPEGERNKVILETLYSCGLRVSELVNLRLSGLYLNVNFIKVIGKGDKERLVPVSTGTAKLITRYIEHVRCHIPAKKGEEDIVFLNRRGHRLTREMIFTIIKRLTAVIGLKKKISPHTFRHSFATHLIEGGADIRAVQEMLGHESITTTEIYTHLDNDYLRSDIITHHPRGRM